MEIKTIEPFLDYYERLRERTRRLVLLIPPDKIEWTYAPGRFTIGELVRHLATIERWMYGETLRGRPTAYPGCGRDLADGYEATLAFFDDLHRESMEIFKTLTPEQLAGKVLTPAGTPISCWKWLRALSEHEIHHRGQLYIYLNMLGVKTPPIFGLSSEEVFEMSTPISK
jgi:uncharacterized damage-inducible protein DinB